MENIGLDAASAVYGVDHIVALNPSFFELRDNGTTSIPNLHNFKAAGKYQDFLEAYYYFSIERLLVNIET